jgi:hypothetical protein
LSVRRFRHLLFVASAAACLGSTQSEAQQIGTAPRGALFGASTDSSSRTTVDVTLALTQARDSESPAALGSGVPQDGPQSGGHSSMALANAEFARRRRTFDLNGTAFSAVRYFQSVDRVSVAGTNASVAGTLRMPKRATLVMTQGAEYSPSYLFRLFPAVAPPEVGASVPSAPDYRVDETSSYALNSQVRFDIGSSRGHRLHLTAERTATDFRGVSQRPDLDVVAGGAGWSRGLGRTATVSAEYQVRRGEFLGSGGTVTDQRLRVGWQFTPALSLTRRATFRFALSPSALAIPETIVTAPATGTLFRLEGEANVVYPLSRSWSAGGTYRRGVEYIAALREPVFRDSVSLDVAGLVSGRIDVSASAGSAVGQSAFNQGGQYFDTYSGTVRGRYSVSRSLALYGEYLYYYYNFHELDLASGLSPRFEQHGVRVGLMVWGRPLGR